jgi:hypothetical protein
MKTAKPTRINKERLILSVVKEKCPNCGLSQVFENPKNIFAIPPMKDFCGVCNYKFDREPGYFLGAMYISYGFAVILAIITFVMSRLIAPGLAIGWYPAIIVLTILLFARKNYKLSRIIYMHIFPW